MRVFIRYSCMSYNYDPRLEKIGAIRLHGEFQKTDPYYAKHGPTTFRNDWPDDNPDDEVGYEMTLENAEAVLALGKTLGEKIIIKHEPSLKEFDLEVEVYDQYRE